MQFIRTSLFSLAVLFLFADPVSAQEKDDVKDATIKGRIVQNQDKAFEINLAELQSTLAEQVQLDPPPIPEGWPDMDLDSRQAWIKKFEASEPGKAFLKQRQEKIDSAAKFDLKVESDGSFVVYDVPHGRYGLRGRHEKEVSGKKYVLEVFGQIDIGANVEEVLLDPMMITATRLLTANEALPKFEVKTFDNKARINNRLLADPKHQDKYFLLHFWSLESPPSMSFSKNVQEMYAKVSGTHKLQLVSICVGSEPEKGLQFVRKEKAKGWHGYVRTWQDEVVREFGVRVLPSLFLVDPKQKIVLTNSEFRQKFQAENAKLTKIVVEAMSKNRDSR